MNSELGLWGRHGFVSESPSDANCNQAQEGLGTEPLGVWGFPCLPAPTPPLPSSGLGTPDDSPARRSSVASSHGDLRGLRSGAPALPAPWPQLHWPRPRGPHVDIIPSGGARDTGGTAAPSPTLSNGPGKGSLTSSQNNPRAGSGEGTEPRGPVRPLRHVLRHPHGLATERTHGDTKDRRLSYGVDFG